MARRDAAAARDNMGDAPAAHVVSGAKRTPEPAPKAPEPEPNPNIEKHRHGSFAEPHTRRDTMRTRQTSIAVHEDNDTWLRLYHARNRGRYKTLSDIWNAALREYRQREDKQRGDDEAAERL